MADEIIKMNSTTAVAVPDRKQQFCAMKKWGLAADHTTFNSDIFGDYAKNLRLTSYLDLDPNNYFTETDVTATNPSGGGTYTYTQITLNHAGYYMFGTRYTILADYPVVQNGASVSNIWLTLNHPENNGWSPTFAQWGPHTDMLGDGAFPTASSSSLGTQFFNASAGSTLTVNISTNSSKIVASGIFGVPLFEYTYVVGMYVGVLDGQTNNGFVDPKKTDPYYSAINLNR